ncbi:hypothetical protein ACFL6S_07440 [Candidatus Poribacteria bacterium]
MKENIVMLEKGVYLPDGAEVEVHLVEHLSTRHEAFTQVLANRITRRVGMAEIIEEDKKEREKDHGQNNPPTLFPRSIVS